MAVTQTWQHTVQHLIASHITRCPRYRVLLFQSSTLVTLDGVLVSAQAAANGLGVETKLASSSNFLDDVGAVACSRASGLIDEMATDRLLLVPGPLNFIDYWSIQVRQTFWRHLATINRGRGIIVTDVPRDSETETTFRLMTRVPGSDLHCLRSRLATGEEDVT